MKNVLRVEIPIREKGETVRGLEELSRLFCTILIWCQKVGIPPEVLAFSVSNSYLIHGCAEYRDALVDEDTRDEELKELLARFASRMDCVIGAGDFCSEDDDDALHLMMCSPARFIAGRFPGFKDPKRMRKMMLGLVRQVNEEEE